MGVVCFFNMSSFFVGREIVIDGVRPLGIIKPLDVHKSGMLQFILVSKMPPIQFLLLEKFKERLYNRIVVWVARRRERLHPIPPIQKTSKQL